MKEKLKQVMADIFGTLPSEIKEDSSIETLESWDSLAHLRLIVTIEEKFGVQVGENDVVGLNNFNSILEFINRNIAK